ncbi:protein AATF isoform X2 [Neltuma alba]|nr:protein AATF-like isoform X2 [Prosopis alba]
MGLSGKRSREAENNDVDWDGYSDMESEQVESDAEDYDDDDDEEEYEDDGEGTCDDEDGTVEEDKWNNDEMEQLEKEYRELHRQEQDTLKNLKRHKDEDLLKGQAVKHQKALWYKILELRVLVQKPYSSSNRLPQEPARSSLYGSDEGVSAAYSDLMTSCKETLNSILELQEALVAQNPSIAQASDGSGRSPKHLDTSKNLDDNFDEEWSQISQMHKRYFSSSSWTLILLDVHFPTVLHH